MQDMEQEGYAQKCDIAGWIVIDQSPKSISEMKILMGPPPPPQDKFA